MLVYIHTVSRGKSGIEKNLKKSGNFGNLSVLSTGMFFFYNRYERTPNVFIYNQVRRRLVYACLCRCVRESCVHRSCVRKICLN